MSNQQTFYNGDDFKLISTDKLNGFNGEFINYTKQKLGEYKNLFEVDKLDKLEFIIFDSLEEYQEDYRKRLGIEPPSYSRGNFNANTVRMVIDQPTIPGTEYFYRARATGAHEAFHIYYRNLFYKKPNDRIVWFDEGMAQYFSGQRSHMDDKSFVKYYSTFRKDYKTVTNLNERIQGNMQVPDDRIFSRKGVINGYPLSYLAIRYLVETEGIEYLKTVMKDKNKILELGNNIQSQLLTYYDRKISEKEHDFLDD